jgi:hypothetical protein
MTLRGIGMLGVSGSTLRVRAVSASSAPPHGWRGWWCGAYQSVVHSHTLPIMS